MILENNFNSRTYILTPLSVLKKYNNLFQMEHITSFNSSEHANMGLRAGFDLLKDVP